MKILHKIKWVLIDLDGTIANSLEELYKVYLEFLKNFNQKGTRKEFESLNGPNLKEMINILKKNHELKESNSVLFKEYFELLRLSYKDKIKPFSESIKLLDYLLKNKINIALVTSSNYEFTKEFLEKYNLTKYFDEIITGETLKNSKPNPEIYELSIKRINANKEDVIVIEDSPNGVSSASKAGLRYIIKKPRSNLIQELENFEINNQS